MRSLRPVVVGISGATCAGKTTLAQFLTKCFPIANYMNQDDFYFDENHKGHIHVEELNHINWEVVTAFDMDKMMAQLDINTEKVTEQQT